MATAVQAGLRDAAKPPSGIAELDADFGLSSGFAGRRVLELGPGHYELSELARDHGASEVVAIDRDPAVAELGRYRGFTIMEGDFRLASLSDLLEGSKFDVVLARGSFNAFWFSGDDNAHEAWIEALVGAMTPGGAALLAPWNNATPSLGLSEKRVSEVLDVQIKTFGDLGFLAFTPIEPYRARWYVSPGETANDIVLCRGFAPPPSAVFEMHSAPDTIQPIAR